ncbi:hypothetical protein LTR97_011563 [Elasticomyces elasticus]|uniref:SMODS and SLOG-associating 2TM effector domain-containing protein n=1 Tax=Elasticomyces elasticus TaxID=574655 RepID=A0AAN7VMS0_9PEZI|nr:hypothetical protein LTR97_011563 [Elasticomyces elasticus]KAK5712292.1 hypothetical protein LTR15_011870 [Elasticomyces elasticus]
MDCTSRDAAMPPDESSPLLQFPGMGGGNFDGLGDHHTQFCHLIGIRPLTHPPGQPWKPQETSLYYRATRHRRNQGATYVLTATLTNTLLLAQIVLGAALTGLGASDSSRVLITVFGALNTVIAGLIAFLRSRGQPVRARMFRDELDRIVNEIENSAVMWHGVARNVHGYDEIDTNDSVTVRSEVARLTRLYDRALKNSTINDPDNFAAGMSGDPYSAALRTRPGQPGQPALPPAVQAPATVVPAAPADVVPITAVVVPDPDESPATKAPEPPKVEEPKPQDAAKAKEDDKQLSLSTAAEDASKPIESGASQPEASSSATKTASDQLSVAQRKPATDRENEPPAGAQSQKHSEDTSH